jgi:hypothetical protein
MKRAKPTPEVMVVLITTAQEIMFDLKIADINLKAARNLVM